MAFHFPVRESCACLLALLSASAVAGAKVSYGIPEGFDAIQMDNSATYVATFNGITLPGLVSYDIERAELIFDSDKYRQNGVPAETLAAIRKVLPGIHYKACDRGCDLVVADHYVTLDKQRRTLRISSVREDFISPDTTWGVVNNQTLDVRGATGGYRAMDLRSNTWVGLPSRSFAYVNWYANRSAMQETSRSDQGISSYYLQKNFDSAYLRAGKQDSLDYASGSVSTLLAPSFDQFLTVGSQGNLRAQQNAGTLVMYSTAEGSYEFYRNGRMILKRPAMLGRNEFSYVDLPGGYYPVEVRLVDRNGMTVNSETRDINNLNLEVGQGTSWHVTGGRELGRGGQLLQASVSHNFSQFYLNASAITGERSRKAAEVNFTRPSNFGDTAVTPTVGLLSGERGTGGYFDLSVTDEDLGSFMLSRYQSTDVSDFYRGAPSTAFSYSRSVGETQLSYNYQKQRRGESHRAEARWNYRPNGLWSSLALGIQKGGFSQDNASYQVYFNVTWMLDQSQASFRAAQYAGRTQLSGDYRKEFTDSYGTSTAGLTVSHIDEDTNVNVYGSRSGTRGDASLSLGQSNAGNNLDFNYRGMVAANADGVAFGRYSSSGSAMLLHTPDLQATPYGFNVEGHPVAGGGNYAVPLKRYGDVSFARVSSDSENMDMQIEVPANIIRAHPGQVYSADAKVGINMVYSGILVDGAGQPVSGRIVETGESAYGNGLFSIASTQVLTHITVEQINRHYDCDLTQTIKDSVYRCQRFETALGMNR
ncbi:hypothetical protein ACVWY1_003378 [Pseudomonas sp. TE6288]|uniref:TcfC E-set like domain-containing protein n=1 Tax=Pseudomonas hunanensis TaxID=1247546 RepID=UPI002405250F|nr:TcfC E-set like domain-containing protein [Pseudomonas hunanensis]MDF9755640.1 hypothetical protein [Pseudomonas hunanensis]